MSVISNKINEDPSEELYLVKRELEKGSFYLTLTFYINIAVIIVALSLSFFYYTYIPENGFFFLLIVFWLSVTTFGIKMYDNISRILLILLSLAIGIAFIVFNMLLSMPYLLVYYPVLFLTLYTLIFHKKTNQLFKYSYNKDILNLNIVIFLEYLYLLIDGFITLPEYVKLQGGLSLAHYLFFLLIFLNLVFVQILNYNARLLMFVTSLIFIVYSIITIESNIYGVVAILLSILMIVELKYDKKVVALFKIKESDNFFFYKMILYINLLSAFVSILGILYLYSIYYILAIIVLGFIYIVFYFICIYEVNHFSFIWKAIFTLFNIGLLIFSVVFFYRFISITAIYLPVSFITIFGLNFDHQTKKLFKRMKDVIPTFEE